MEVEDNPDDAGLEEISEGDVSDSKCGNKNRTQTDTTIKYRQGSDVFIAEGFYTDCDNLLKRFLSLKTSTFEDFVKLWKEKKFSSIFCGRDSYSETLEFSEEALTIAKSFILPPHSKVKRIGALYLMYGIYSRQPIYGLVKFRFTPPEWSVILKFVENLKVHGFIDANYIFHKMCIDGAFLTVAYSREYGLERNYRKYLMPWPARDKELDPNSTFSLETLMSRVYRGSLKAVADQCLKKYNSMKQLLEASKASKFQGVTGTDRELEQVMQTDIEDVIGSADALKSTRKVTNIGHGRKNLKDKAFQHHSYQKGSCISEICSSQSSSQDSENCQKAPDAPSESDSDSEDIEFQLMVKPPSKRNSRRIKSMRLAKLKKIEEVESEESGLTHARSAQRASLEEIVSETVSRTTATSKKQSIASSKVPIAKGTSPQSCPHLEIDTASNFETMTGACNDSVGNVRSAKRKSPQATLQVTTIDLAAEAPSSTQSRSDLSAEKPVKNDCSKVGRKSNRKNVLIASEEESFPASLPEKRRRKRTLSSSPNGKPVS